jgi:hypothetical protein
VAPARYSSIPPPAFPLQEFAGPDLVSDYSPQIRHRLYRLHSALHHAMLFGETFRLTDGSQTMPAGPAPIHGGPSRPISGRCPWSDAHTDETLAGNSNRLLNFYSTLVSSRNRCNSLKTNGRIHFYSTKNRGGVLSSTALHRMAQGTATRGCVALSCGTHPAKLERADQRTCRARNCMSPAGGRLRAALTLC